MNSETPVTLHQTFYRGLVAFQVRWAEEGTEREKTFPTEAEAVAEMAVIEERLRVAKMAGQGLTVNPFGMHIPFISSKDVNFAALKLQPRGLKFRESIDDYVAAINALNGLETTVAAAVAGFVEASQSLKSYDVSVQQAVFEWLELKKQTGDRPLYEVLGAYLKMKASADAEKTDGAAGATPSPA
ncbi:MAG TPA: hypothetical protein VL357_09610 [Rariglobus sp.]|nr:hypothetical protein [Rariglobus sp.]